MKSKDIREEAFALKAKVTGLEGIVAADTEIGYVNGAEGKLVYRGYWAKDLAVRHTFEEAAYLLWYGELPDDSALRSLRKQLKAHRILEPELKRLLDAMPKGTPMMNVLMAAVASLSEEDSEWPPKAEQAIRLTAKLPAIIAYRYRKANGLPWLEPNEDCGHADYYLQLLFGHRPVEAHVRAVNAYMILAMEHGLNASTFAARVVSSTESDLYAAVSAAIGAMKGPLHGGAPSGVIKLLEDIGEKERAEPHIRGMLEKGERLMGFGHRIYKTPDPRAEALRDVTAALSGDDPWLDLARHAERTAIRLLAEYKPERKLHTNVEFYAAAVMRAVQMPPQLFTPTFTAARVVGWTAHILEQAQINRIYRPQSVYVGAMPVEG